MRCVSERKVDRIKKKFVQEGLDLTLNRQPSQREYELKVDGRLEAQLLAMSCSAPPWKRFWTSCGGRAVSGSSWHLDHDPWAYLKDVLARLTGHLNSRIDELLPHRW